ncbi:MAG: electron transport complex subunit RsxC [Clostridiales bacterium]|nr:electron transport complex subunit RsxC [Clostridiales bacterium]
MIPISLRRIPPQAVRAGRAGRPWNTQGGIQVRTYNFPGGVHPVAPSYDEKPTGQSSIRVMPAPDVVVIPMVRVFGAPLTPLVKRGDFVKLGQRIGDSDEFVSAPIHASVSGKVIAVEPRPHPTGRRLTPSVIIANDRRDEWDPSCTPHPDPDALTGEEIIALVRDKGIVGLGGATFPTHVKLRPPKGGKIDILIANGAECEPYLSADDRLMQERSHQVIDGMKLAMRALGVTRAYIGIEANKPAAIRAVTEAAKNTPVRVRTLKVKYPQGGEKQIIYALTGRQVRSGRMPSDAGCAVFNVGTLAAIHRAVVEGRPMIDRVVTVAGSAVWENANLEVRIGTSLRACIKFCGGYTGSAKPDKLISGGPMMGTALYTDEVPMIAGTSGILALTGEQAHVPPESACIRCGRCHHVCPINLQPYAISDAMDVNDAAKAAQFSALDCIECGACVYICPARRHLLQNIRLAKALLRGAGAGVLADNGMIGHG